MSDITINYKGNAIATMDASGTKKLLTDGKYCEDDIEVVYVKPGGGTPNLQAKTNINATTSSQTITADEGYDGLSSVQINALDGQAAQTIHPSTSDQTIASGKYLTGAQTVKGVLLTNLDAGNIKKDVVVKIGDSTDDDCVTSVTGTYEGGGGGSNSPLVSSTISIPNNPKTIDIALPRTVTNAVVLVEATNAGLAVLAASTSTAYHIVSGIFFYPTGSMTIGSKTQGRFGNFERYRPSATTFYAQHGASLSLSGTTMTLTLDSGTYFLQGTDTYNVKVWEVATS